MPTGWRSLLPDAGAYRGAGKYRIDAYSEYTPPPRVGWKPYGSGAMGGDPFTEDDPHGWCVDEFEEALELKPGLAQVAERVLAKLGKLLDGNPRTGFPKRDLAANPFWPAELANAALPHERCVALLPLALSRTQDDKGRVRWTFFGSSECGSGRAFWKSFFAGPNREVPKAVAAAFFCRLLAEVYGEELAGVAGLKRAGFRILPDEEPLLPEWKEELPQWTAEFLLGAKQAGRTRYLLTFRPFASLPDDVRAAYLAGTLHLLPFPGSLLYWGVRGYRRLADELPGAMQIPLLFGMDRHRRPGALRIPQSGFLHVPTAAKPDPPDHALHINNTYKRTHRWDKVLRDADELALIEREDKLLHVLFSTLPDDLTLYDKPMARNVQIWTEDFRLLLDGPNAAPKQLRRAMETAVAGGLFGYRFLFPAMRVGRHEVVWHRPLVAYLRRNGEAAIVPGAPTGYFTATPVEPADGSEVVELWPRFHSRPLPLEALGPPIPEGVHRNEKPLQRVRELFDTFARRGGRPLPRSLARQVLVRGQRRTLENWLQSLPKPLAREVGWLIEPTEWVLPKSPGAAIPDSLTYERTATRAFELKYWGLIAGLSEGTFVNKNNADCIRDDATRKLEADHHRHLEKLGDHLLRYYTRAIADAGLAGKARAGSLPFRWRTDFDYSWMGGWLKNQTQAAERNLIVVIPGRNRKEAIVMADHYDTAYMADRYAEANGARLAACGADDNHSATSAMMLAAPIFLDMSRRGELARDIWLVHLTGEEFPADCLGARALTERLVERSLRMHLPEGAVKNLSGAEVRGLYVSDMIAHNNDRARDIFQIAPGADRASLRLAELAHAAAETWNESVTAWNRATGRLGKARSRRSRHGDRPPAEAPFPVLSGEIRTHLDPRSTLYNTDGQVFSDAGVPCVLFMENYDIARSGYHDAHDTMENIDLDYGAALCAITIESVARAATAEGV